MNVRGWPGEVGDVRDIGSLVNHRESAASGNVRQGSVSLRLIQGVAFERVEQRSGQIEKAHVLARDQNDTSARKAERAHLGRIVAVLHIGERAA